jgi:hypothetical protein
MNLAGFTVHPVLPDLPLAGQGMMMAVKLRSPLYTKGPGGPSRVPSRLLKTDRPGDGFKSETTTLNLHSGKFYRIN